MISVVEWIAPVRNPLGSRPVSDCSTCDRARNLRRSRHAARRLSPCPRLHRGARRAAVPRRPGRAVDARRQPHQVAPGAHHLVLRDVPAACQADRLPAVRPDVQRTCSTRTTRRVGPRHPRPQRGLLTRPASARSRPTARTSTTAMHGCSTTAPADTARADRTRACITSSSTRNCC